jgi:cytochrome c553
VPFVLGAAIVFASVATQAIAAESYGGDPAKGLRKSLTCVPCHEGHGRSTGTSLFPRIGGQDYDYLYLSLREYRDGQRRRGWARTLMADSVRDLSDDDLRDIARYFATLPW